MKIAVIIVRSLLGLAFVVFGLNGFLNFMKGELPAGPGRDFAMAMMNSGYFHVVAALELIGGALLLSGRYVALGLTLLGPVVVNIVLFHIFLEHSGLPIAAVFAALTLFVLWSERAKFAPLLKA